MNSPLTRCSLGATARDAFPQPRSVPLKTRVRSLVEELKRRHVFRVMIAYMVVAWVIVQVAVVVFPSLAIPDWVVTFVTVMAILGFPLAIALAWALETPDPAEVDAPEAAVSETPLPHRKDGPIESVAVLPFVNLSADPEQEFFSDGMAEELLDALAKIDGLRVPARTSSFAFKGRAVDVREIGGTLGVEAVLEGSVRKSADRIRVTSQLVSAHDGYHLWSETYDRTLDDVFRIQEDLARSIVDALAVRLSGSAKRELVQAGTDDFEAYALVLKGRQAFARRDRESMLRAKGFFEAALERDPDYAAARSGLADVLWVGALNGLWRWGEVAERARAESTRAVDLAPDLSEAHASRGGVLSCDGRWEEAGVAYRRALELAPGNAQVHSWLASVETWRGRPEEGVRLHRRAASLDPLSRTSLAAVGSMTRDWLSDPDTAAEWFEKALEIDPSYIFPLFLMAQLEAERGRMEEARRWAARALETDPEDRAAWTAKAYVEALGGNREEALGIVESRLADDPGAASVYMALGEPERALDQLERVAVSDDPAWYSIIVDRSFAPIRSHPRFVRILERVGARWGDSQTILK